MSPRYNYGANLPRQKLFIKRFKVLIAVVVLVLFVVGIVISFDSWRQSLSKNTEGSSTTQTIRSRKIEFETDYFKFKAGTNWRSVPDQSNSNKFVYRSVRGTLIEQELDVYIGAIPADAKATHVLPIQVQDNRIITGKLSNHCSNALVAGASRVPTAVVYQDIRFLCNVDGTDYTVVVGARGGDTGIKLMDANGKAAIYGFVYRNSTVQLDPKDLLDIINSFQAR